MPTLRLVLDFHPLARRPDLRRWGRRWDVEVVVDGTLHVFEEGPRHELVVPPGPHRVEVAFRPAGLASLARRMRLGGRSLEVQVPDGGTAELTYRGGLFWHVGGSAALTQTG